MKISKFIFATLLAIPMLVGCGAKSQSYTLTFHQDEGNKNDTFIYHVGKTTYSEVKAFQDKIEINSRRGYDVSWEDFDLSIIDSDYTINAVYDLHDFVITYKYETRVIGTATYTIESQTVEEPPLPTTAGYLYHYEDYSFIGKAEDFTVMAYREMVQYYATFVDIDGNPICDPIPFNINTESIEEPEVPAIVGYDGVWESYVLGASDITIHPIYSVHYYYASFWTSNDENKELVAKVPFVAGDTFIEEPAVPISSDYRDGYWSNYVLGTEDIDIYPVYTNYHVFTAFYKQNSNDKNPIKVNYTYETRVQTVLDNTPGYITVWQCNNIEYVGGTVMEFPMHDITFIKKSVEGRKYTVTLNPEGGTLSGESVVTVTFGQNYKLETPAYYSAYYDFLGWYGEDGATMESEGTWNVTHDVVAYARYGLSFETEVPEFITPKVNIASLSIADGGTVGNKSLKITVSGSDYGVYFSKDFLDDTFSNPDVVAINFDAKGSDATNNFRAKIAGNNVTYEQNDSKYGLQTNWKTFSFKRSYYDDYIEGDAMIYGGNYTSGKYVMIDNVVPVTKDLDSYGFENGYVDDTKMAYYSSGHGNSNPAPIQIIHVDNSSKSNITKFAADYDHKTEGNRSLTITKNNGWVAFYLPNTTKATLGNNGYVKLDFYSTIVINSNPNTKNLVDNTYTPFGGDGYYIPAGTWISLIVPVSGVGNDGRFLMMQGSTAGSMYFDNITLVYAD